MNYQMFMSSSSYTHIHGEGNNKILFHIRCNFKQNNFRKIGDGTHILHYSPSLKIMGYGKSTPNLML